MCQRNICKNCGRPSFTGCGRHVESVLKDVPVAMRCPGHAPKDSASVLPGGSPSLLKRLRDFVSGPPEGRRS
jgi:hypothetical protein